ncbi:leucine-rich repeat domain-containing protein [Metamycoplasma equirhinis]|uniref:leucine-rich repeat domain-containing protein n=1 Tax=Metamycoplasma equirhinis TaxID=92402 RepID=UPI003593133D
MNINKYINYDKITFMKKNKLTPLLVSLGIITPAVSSLVAISCKGEKANLFAHDFILGEKAAEYYNKDTKTLDLSKAKIKSIPAGSFSFSTLHGMLLRNIKDNKQVEKVAEGLYDFENSKINIEKVILPSGLENIDSGAFVGLGTIKELDFTATNLKYIRKDAFAFNSIENLKLPKTIEKIEERAFYKNKIQKINFGELENLRVLTEGVFEENELDDTINLGNVTEIRAHALANNKFTKLELNDYVNNVSYLFLQYDLPKGVTPESKTVKLKVKNESTKKFLNEQKTQWESNTKNPKLLYIIE